MAGAGTVILGILGGAIAVGGTLAAVDPLGARRHPPRPPEGLTDTTVQQASGGTLGSVEAAQNALVLLGYEGGDAVRNFQGDTNEIRTFMAATYAGQEPVPPAGAGFTQLVPALQALLAAGDQAGPQLATTGELDAPTLTALGEAVRAAVFSSGTACMTPAGQAVEADTAACRQAWQDAFRYAYEANLAAQNGVAAVSLQWEPAPPGTPEPPPGGSV